MNSTVLHLILGNPRREALFFFLPAEATEAQKSHTLTQGHPSGK